MLFIQVLRKPKQRESDSRMRRIYSRLLKTNSIGRLVKAEDIANVITFLASPLSVSITGDVISVTGGTGNAVHLIQNINHY